MSISRIKGVFFRYLLVLKKGPYQLSDLFYWPFMDILLWGLTSVWIHSIHSHIQNFPLILMTGLILWQTVTRGSIDISISITQEFWHRNLINLFSTPLRLREWIGGVLLLSLLKLFITIAFGSFMIYLLYSIKVFTIGWYFLPFVLLLLLFGWTLGFISGGFIIYWGHQVEVIGFLIAMLFAPFSAVFYPISALPNWAQTISWLLPTTYVFEGMRSILLTSSFPSLYFFKSLFLNLFYLTLAITFFRTMFKKSLAKGLARLE